MITKKDRTLGYAFGLGTAFFWGVAAVTIKHATQFAPPFVILTFALLAGLIVVLLSTTRDFRNGVGTTNKRAISLLITAGFLNGIALAFYYSFLAKAPVVLVSPLAAACCHFPSIYHSMRSSFLTKAGAAHNSGSNCLFSGSHRGSTRGYFLTHWYQ